MPNDNLWSKRANKLGAGPTLMIQSSLVANRRSLAQEVRVAVQFRTKSTDFAQQRDK